MLADLVECVSAGHDDAVRDAGLLHQPPRFSTLAAHRRKDTFVPKNVRRPAEVVLPSEEEITGRAQLGFMFLPDVPRYLDNRAAAAEVLKGLEHPGLQVLLRCHSRSLA